RLSLRRAAISFLQRVGLGLDFILVAQAQRVEQPAGLAVLRRGGAERRLGYRERLLRLLRLGLSALGYLIDAGLGVPGYRIDGRGHQVVKLRAVEIFLADRFLGFLDLLLREQPAFLFLQLFDALAHLGIARVVRIALEVLGEQRE